MVPKRYRGSELRGAIRGAMLLVHSAQGYDCASSVRGLEPAAYGNVAERNTAEQVLAVTVACSASTPINLVSGVDR
jgi:hypothetical protein